MKLADSLSELLTIDRSLCATRLTSKSKECDDLAMYLPIGDSVYDMYTT